MRQGFTDVTVVLDRSGSMASTKADAEGGFNTFIDEQKKVPGLCVVSLAQFDDQYENVYSGKPLAEVPNLVISPRGNTALLDAIGKTITATGERLEKMAEADRPEHVIFIVVTDGQENASREWSSTKIHDAIKHQREKYNWQFVFMGATQDSIAMAKSVGFAPTGIMQFASNAVGTRRSYGSMSAAVANTRLCAAPTGFTQKDRDEQTASGVQ